MSLTGAELELLVWLRLFDAEWYQSANDDVRASGLAPWEHFLQFGFDEGRQPGPGFNPEQYLLANPDLNYPGVNLLGHYLRAGHAEGRSLSPEEKAFRLESGRFWPERPVPESAPDWLGSLPGAAAPGVLRVMYVLSVQSGGTPATNQDLMLALGARKGVSVECFVLRCAGRYMVLYLFVDGVYVPLERYALPEPVAAFPHSQAQYDNVVKRWLAAYGIHLVHVRHSVWQSLGLMDAASELSIPVVYSFHDYYTVCPSVKLLDENQRFCGGRCTAGRGECKQELWQDKDVLPLKHESVYSWQGQFSGALALCSAFVTTTPPVKEVILDIFPALGTKPFEIIPHGRDFTALESLVVEPRPDGELRVLLPGHIAPSKGAEILLELADLPGLSHVQWHVLGTLTLGSSAANKRKLPGNVIVHGHYQRAEFHRRVAQIQPHMGAVLSIWPETWCHTLTELWAAGLPVLGFNTGAVGERLQQTGAGWLAVDISAEAMAETLRHASGAEEWRRVVKQVKHWQQNGQRSCAQMAEDYWYLYNRVTGASL